MAIYISLGSDCSVSYNLRALNLQSVGSMPFDWMKLTNISNLIDILANDFNDFVNIDSYDSKEQHNVFDYIDGNMTGIKSLVKLVHKRYKFTLPHEYSEYEINIIDFVEKYSRRIEKFKDIVKNDFYRKVFVRLGNTKDEKEISNLDKVLHEYGCVNYELRFVNCDKYSCDGGVYSWKRDYIPWASCLL